MITIKKHVIVTAIVLSAGLGLVGVTNAIAQETSDSQTTLVQKIAQKFGLKQEDVQAVFDDHREEHQVRMKVKMDERLDTLVTDGKITEEQKKLILQKHQELQANHKSMMQEFQDKTPDERRAAMEEHKKALDAWAEQNGIDPHYVIGGFRMKMHGGMKMMH